MKYRNPTTGKKTFKQRTLEEDGRVSWSVAQGIPYNYPQLIDGIKNGKLVLFVEGEKDAETAKLLGYVGTTMGSASDWKDEYSKYFRDANLILIPDKDDAGLRLAGKMIDALKPVVKSLRTMVLPIGKDLTEWVEFGNHDLRPLVEASTELKTTNGVPEPIVKVIVGGFEFFWLGLDLKIVIDHVLDDDNVEIVVYEKDKQIYVSGYKLLSITHKESLARSLKRINDKFKWDTIVNQITVQCLSRIRNGENVITLDHNVGGVKPEYLIHPLFVKNNANIIYAERSSAKSLFMNFIAILLTYNWKDNPYGLLIPGDEYRVLILDWENDPNTVGWQKQCLVRGFNHEWCDISYLHCSLPLVKCLPQIQQKINEVRADTIIIDSLGLAVGGDLNISEPALNFFHALRQLPVTPLIIAHTSKDLTNKKKTVYGNAFYENLSRSIWELYKYQEQGSHELTLSLYNRKSPPFSGYHSPLAFQFRFDGDRIMVDNGEVAEDKRNGE
jgi:hypothetical protein